MAKGEWLGIGGGDPSHHGGGSIEVRVAGDGAAWEWKAIPQERLHDLLKLLNEHPGRRDDLLRAAS